MPLEVCKLSSEKWYKVLAKTFETSLEKGYFAAQKIYFYCYKF